MATKPDRAHPYHAPANPAEAKACGEESKLGTTCSRVAGHQYVPGTTQVDPQRIHRDLNNYAWSPA